MESGGKAKAASSDAEDVRSGRAAPALVEAREEDGAPAVSSLPALVAVAAPPAARPYYECVFCKRGFSAAQALGGHMNIHRRDRARPARAVDAHTTTCITSSSVSRSTAGAECYSKYRHFPYTQAPPAMPPMSRAMSLYYYPGAAAAPGGVDEEAVSPSPIELALFGADVTRDHDQDLHLSLGCHGRGGEGPERQDGEPERKLDLELRLGVSSQASTDRAW